jgi:hypothetical protein
MYQAFTASHVSGKVYVGQTGRSKTARCKEHERHIRLCQPEKSAVEEHCLETGHRIELEEVTVLTRSAGYMDRLVKEAIEIRLHPDNFKRDNGFILSHAWYPFINQLHKTRQVKQHPESLEPERTEPGLSDTNREQEEEDHQCEGPG